MRCKRAALAVMAAAALLPLTGAMAKTSNDAFAEAGTLAMWSVVWGNTAGNTVEPGEQQPCGMIGATGWWRLETTPDQPLRIDTYASSFDTVLAVYQGTALADLAVVDCVDDTDHSSQATLTFTPGDGVYWVQLGGFAGKAGDFYLGVGSAPANDSRAQAADASDGFEEWVYFDDADRDDDGPYGCSDMGHTLWYRVDVPVDTEVAVLLSNAMGEWAVEVFEQRDNGTLRSIGCEYDYTYDGEPIDFRMRVPASPGRRLYVRVGSYYGGDARLRILPLHLDKYRLPNDTAASAMPITSLPFSHTTDTSTATARNEPDACAFNGATVWYRFAPALPTPVVAHTVGSEFDSVIAVFRQDGDTLTKVACNDDASPWGLAGTESLVRFAAEAGAVYLFQVGGYEGRNGSLTFDVAGAAL